MNSSGSAHRPGAMSLFFIYHAGVFALGFWTWFAVLALTADHVGPWLIVAGAGAATATLVGVALGLRYEMQRSAALRHEEIMRTLVEISWYGFASSVRTGAGNSPSNDAHPAVGRISAPRQGGGENADVLHLAEETRPRPRR